jgi:hypothetical protein
MRKAIIVDMDGTLALMGDRSPFDDHLAGADTPNMPEVSVVKAVLAADPSMALVVMSGRDAGRSLDVTMDWLVRHGFAPDLLLMRAHKDFRKDSVVKRDLFDAHVAGRFDVTMVFDDRDSVVAMWRHDLGLPVMQVADGSF